MLRFLLLASLGLSQAAIANPTAPNADPMFIDVRCLGNHYSGCFIIMTGRISESTPARLQQAISEPDAHQILFHSTGGDLEAGLEIGRMIREHGLNTSVGRPVWVQTGDRGGVPQYAFADLDRGECSSACAYAFLGGVSRDLASGQLGFHRFSPIDGSTQPGTGGLIAGQLVSSVIVEYLAEMGIDPRIFRLASGTASNELYFPSAEEFAALMLSTPLGFGPMRLEPMGQGVAAVSDNLDPSNRHFVEVNVYCKFGHPRLTLLSDIGQPGIEQYGGWWLRIDEQEIDIEKFQIEDAGVQSLFHYELDESYSGLLASASSIVVSFYTAEASGGLYEAHLSLNDQDRASLSAALNNCVER